MAMSQYKVGQKPRQPLGITIRDSRGRNLDLSLYTNFTVRIVGPNNEEVDTTGAVINTGGFRTGRIVLEWPTDRSLFEEPGDYLLEVILSDGVYKDITTEHTIRVRELGRLFN